MVRTASNPQASVVLVFGEDEFSVKQRARELFEDWRREWTGLDHEVIDACVSNSGEALTALARLREALQTLPFFGDGKVIWLQNCNFLGDERAASTRAVTESLAELAGELRTFRWETVRLLISAGKVDKRKTFYKTLEKIGRVEPFAGWSVDDRNWAAEAEATAERRLRASGKRIAEDALAELVAAVGPAPRSLHNEIEKLITYVGDRTEIHAEDVTAIVTRNKQTRAFALADALGTRDAPRLLRTLDEELWESKRDTQKSEIGMLYGLISKVRVMIFLKEMIREGWLKPESEYGGFKSQLERVPQEMLPSDKRFNPLAMHPFLLFNALGHARRYTLPELVRAMDLLLDCNQKLISSGLEAGFVLQQTLLKIVQRGADGGPGTPPRTAAPRKLTATRQD